MNDYGYKILYDGFDYFICLLKIPKDSCIIALDYKYRTDKVYIYDIRRIRNCKSKNIVNHHCFYDNNLLIKYEINTYLETNYLDTSFEICASGIHYFPLTTNIDYVSKYFKNFPIDWYNVQNIVFLWCLKIVSRKISITNFLKVFTNTSFDPITLFLAKKEDTLIYTLIKKDM